MNKNALPENTANLSAQLESFLIENGAAFFRRTVNQRELFDMVTDTDKKGLTEQRITAYVHDNLIFFEASFPVAYADSDAVAAIVNDLNIRYPVGSFQFDARDGQLTWTQFLAARNGSWPGNDSISAVFNAAREMTGLLYQKLLALDDESARSEM